MDIEETKEVCKDRIKYDSQAIKGDMSWCTFKHTTNFSH